MRYNREALKRLCDNLNNRFAQSKSQYCYRVESRNGYTAVDLVIRRGDNLYCLYAVGTGTPKECAFAVAQHALALATGFR